MNNPTTSNTMNTAQPAVQPMQSGGMGGELYGSKLNTNILSNYTYNGPKSAFEVFKFDHKVVKDWFTKLESWNSQPHELAELRHDLTQIINNHEATESAYLWPLLSGTEGKAINKEAELQNAEIKRAMKKFEGATVEDMEYWKKSLKELQMCILADFTFEEEKLFPYLQSTLSLEQQNVLYEHVMKARESGKGVHGLSHLMAKWHSKLIDARMH